MWETQASAHEWMSVNPVCANLCRRIDNVQKFFARWNPAVDDQIRLSAMVCTCLSIWMRKWSNTIGWCPLHRHRNLSGWKTCHGSCKEILIWISNWTDGTILGDILTVMWWVYRPSRWKRAFESHPPPGRWSEVVWIHPEPYSPIGRKLVSQLRMCFKRALQLNRNSLRPCVVDTDDCPFKQTVWIRGRVRYIPI